MVLRKVEMASLLGARMVMFCAFARVNNKVGFIEMRLARVLKSALLLRAAVRFIVWAEAADAIKASVKMFLSCMLSG